MSTSPLFQKTKSFPTSSGVYIFKDSTGEIIYVGKATSLKDRVGSYFQSRSGYARPIELFIDQVADIEIKKTETVLEAYILEQELIKKWQPKFNVDGKDDKSFCYVVITKEDFPQIMIFRKTDLEKMTMHKFSISNKLSSLKHLNKKTFEIGNLKLEIGALFGPYLSKKHIEIALKILRKIFPYHSKTQKTEKGCLDFQIGLCPGPYAGVISKEDYAKNIRGIGMILSGKKKTLLNKLKKEMLEYSEQEEFEKALKVRNEIFALQHIQDIALISKRDDNFQVKTVAQPMRIECYDISNISGKYSVGSMIVFDNASGELEANKSQYRKFKIKTVDGANDVASMMEVLSRRLANNWTKPNLIILDGGQGHLNAVRRVLKNFHLEIPLLAIAKGPKRNKLDRYAFGSVPEISETIIEQMRDEAHRFAITYHRKVRAKNFIR